MLLGLTGQYCAGKNHIAKFLEARGFEVLDVDKLGHQAIEEERDSIVERFGPGVLRADGTVDRKVLGSMVFGKAEKLAELEGLIHPAANRLTERWIQARNGKNLVVNAALLHRSSVFSLFDCVILVKAALLTRLFRALKRDKLPISTLIERFRSQEHFESQYYANKTDIYIVRNEGSFGLCAAHRARALGRRIDSILTRIGMVR
ncbi:MAG: dephospho-CoA kinase [Treponemataceae bacterium]